jgi:alpha-mannosidase
MLELRTPNVMVSGVKKAEDSEAIIIRLYEFEGRETEAKVWLCEEVVPPDAPAVETDLLEQPLPTNTARMKDGLLTVKVPAFGITTVKVG